ncbi:MAG TPA: GNAT family N-acetyltransferase [Gaiellaceae bacterium]|nr:GNAT family N-acetyltransferase [Gaiellaceae bacterium]
MEGWFELPRVVWFGVAEREGRVMGYADLQQSDEHADVDARALDADAALALVQACVERARSGAPVWGYAASTDDAATAAYQSSGFAVIRHSFSMLIELPERSADAEWPDGVEVRPWQEGDDPAFHAALQETFAEHFGFEARSYDEWLHAVDVQPETNRSLWFLALAGDDVAGALVCSWHSSGDRTYGWVNELGVRKAWRRRGLGLALLRHAFAELGRLGANRVGLGVDGENTTGAVRLYERAGMHVTRRYDTWELRR